MLERDAGEHLSLDKVTAHSVGRIVSARARPVIASFNQQDESGWISGGDLADRFACKSATCGRSIIGLFALEGIGGEESTSGRDKFGSSANFFTQLN